MERITETMTLQEVSAYFGLSEQTIRRRMKDARNGRSTFPRPIFGSGGRKALWRKTDIENWNETKLNMEENYDDE